MNRATFRYVESELYTYQDLCREIEDLRTDIIEGVPAADENGGKSYEISDPAFNKAAQLVTNRRLQWMERSIKAISCVLLQTDEQKRRLIELKYWDGRLSNTGIAEALNIELSTFYRWRRAVVHAVAVEMGLINAVNGK